MGFEMPNRRVERRGTGDGGEGMSGTRPAFFMLSSAEHEILNAHKYKISRNSAFFQTQISRECYFPAHKC